MAYERQLNDSLERMDQALFQLRNIVKRGQIQEALQFMEEGPLKERFEDLKNIANISVSNNFGARGVKNTNTL